jgi:hypothetical protein
VSHIGGNELNMGGFHPMIARSKKLEVLVLTSFLLLTLAVSLLVPMASARAQQRPQLGENSIAEVVNAMTVEDKVELLVGMGLNLAAMLPDTGEMAEALAAFAAMLPAPPPEGLEVPDKVPGTSGRTHAVPQLGVPSITLTDGPAGVRVAPIPSCSTPSGRRSARSCASMVWTSCSPRG